MSTDKKQSHFGEDFEEFKDKMGETVSSLTTLLINKIVRIVELGFMPNIDIHEEADSLTIKITKKSYAKEAEIIQQEDNGESGGPKETV